MRVTPGRESRTVERRLLNAWFVAFIMILIAAMGSASAAGAYDPTSQAENVAFQVFAASDTSVAPVTSGCEQFARRPVAATGVSARGYDAPPEARHDVNELEVAEASTRQVKALQVRPASPAVEARTASTTPFERSVATNKATQDAAELRWRADRRPPMRLIEEALRVPCGWIYEIDGELGAD